MFTLIGSIRTVLLATVIFTLGFAVAAPAQTTWHVDDDAAPGGDGTSWPAAFEYLQDALAAAGAGDEIRVAQGIYKPDRDCDHPDGTGDREATFQLITGVALFGGYAGLSDPNDPDARDVELYESILSGDLLGNDGDNFENYDENSYHVVTGSGTDESTILDGFTITAGNANVLIHEEIYAYGAGMFNNRGNPAISNCAFRENRVLKGGSGVFNLAGSLTVTRCAFSRNYAGQYGGGIYNVGPLSPAKPTVMRCIFTGNYAGEYGGGIFNHNRANVSVVNCLITNNYADYGGAICNSISDVIVADCTLNSNSSISGGGTYQKRGNSTLANCVVWANTPDQIVNADGGSTNVSYSDIQGGWPGEGNIDADPLFVDPDGPDDDPNTWEDNNYRIAGGSPCIDAGDNDAVPPDTLDLDGDGDTTEPTPFDLDGNPRFVDDPDTPDTGNGEPPIVDMGAYEFQAGPVTYLDIKPGSCPNPLNRNSHGVLPVALVGIEDFDVTQVDLDLLELTRADGVGGSVTPLMGPPGPGIRVEDVATPFDGEPCDCHELEGDGIADLAMKFDTPELVAVLELADLPGGSSVELVLSGELLDTTHFSASDCVILVPQGPRPGGPPAQSGPKGDGLDSVPEVRQVDPAAGQDADRPDELDPQPVGCGVLPPGLLLTATAAMYLISRPRAVDRSGE